MVLSIGIGGEKRVRSAARCVGSDSRVEVVGVGSGGRGGQQPEDCVQVSSDCLVLSDRNGHSGRREALGVPVLPASVTVPKVRP